ncbi:hypothetical protein K438DRAFT_1868768 [Mycena galopus ATCC 62051]|nr:hypothetical protein K438DRAFT_1868768 [Mycena galopus ATCC 62051]
MDRVESFYRECCEQPDKGIAAVFKVRPLTLPSPRTSHSNEFYSYTSSNSHNLPSTHPRTVDFSGVWLTSTTASILADVVNIDWGLRKAVFRECDLDDLMCCLFCIVCIVCFSLAYGFPRLHIGFLSSGFPPRLFLSPFRFDFVHVLRLRRSTHPHGSTRSTARMRSPCPTLALSALVPPLRWCACDVFPFCVRLLYPSRTCARVWFE